MNDLRKFDGECPTINRYGDGETKCSRYVSTRVRYITRSWTAGDHNMTIKIVSLDRTSQYRILVSIPGRTLLWATERYQ